MTELNIELGVKERSIKVKEVSNNNLYYLIEFEESWFQEGDVLIDIEDETHDIELQKKLDNRTFIYKGTAYEGEIYRKIANKIT